MRSLQATCAVSSLFLLALGCRKEERAAAEKAETKQEEQQKPAANVDPDLARAVAAASAKAPPPAELQAGGPPPNGVFPPGAADREVQRGDVPKVALGSPGSEPRLKLQPELRPGTKLAGNIELALQNDPQLGAVPVEFVLAGELETPKSKASAGAPNEAKNRMLVRVVSARINGANVPKEIQSAVAQARGSRIDYQLLPNGAGTDFNLEVAKGMENEWRDLVRSLSDTLALLAIPYPSEAVGVGAYWMVTSRDGVLGLDLVTYRLIKVEKLEGEKVTLSVNTKRYSASSDFNLEGLPPDAPRTLAEFQARSDGTLELHAGAILPESGQIKSGLAAALAVPDSKQPAMLELQSRARVALRAQ